MKIYRIENVTGEGPYSCAPESRKNFSSMVFYTDPHPYLHPLQEEDNLLREIWKRIFYNDLRRNWRFGFDSVDQVILWFHAEGVFEALELDGFMVSEYEVPEGHYHLGEFQAIFEPFHSEFVRYITFTSLEKGIAA
ncbi:hypothetical protein AU106_gp087 [Sinorhizobium phage phiM9]|uniref:Uncharacterized protein n=1 Tax=Sinorhizobium phage phiM9 TaxID=1636182 RepID=A0A0F6R7I1_9CAUD|nr:hypothetical protein AU106_gp087 [Sinorhizobium phage phiM9]AKE44718.1 hypothetical protein Sm_phiM9_089 [Sinorhizobium phage phiM9]